MLTELHIQNIAVIHKAQVSLSPGLNVFTGETGAGKTILISAIDAVLGERTSKDIIRSGEDTARVTALFEQVSPRVLEALEELGYSDDNGDLLISREIHLNGKNSCKINGVPATTSILKSVASLLIHVHGQRDSMQLLAGEQHLRLIDAFGGLEGEVAAYRAAYDAMCDLRGQLEALETDEAQKVQKIDMLTFQINEIEAAGLEDPREEEELLSQRKLIQNSAHVRDALGSAYLALRGDGEVQGIDALMDILSASVQEIAQYMSALAPMAGRVEEMGYELVEFSREIRDIIDDFEFDPRELDAVESRLDVIYKLKRKYGSSIAEILEHLERAREELEAIETSGQRAAELAAALEQRRQEVDRLAGALTKKRHKAAAAFVKGVEAELTFLDMPSVKLSVQRREREPGPTGIDDLEFYIVTNVGEEPKPLSKIASGGEVSRIMLAVKNVLAERDDVSTLIFDEVDTGVSGRAAGRIGSKLLQVARERQVICVTHLAQVAAFADNHLLIRKEVEAGRTFTRIIPLDEESSVGELARIASGDMMSDAALQSARELRQRSREGL